MTWDEVRSFDFILTSATVNKKQKLQIHNSIFMSTHLQYLWCIHKTMEYDGFFSIMISKMARSHGHIFRVTGLLWGEYTGHLWILLAKVSDTDHWFFFDLRLNIRVSKQSIRRLFEAPLGSLWRHCYDIDMFKINHGAWLSILQP